MSLPDLGDHDEERGAELVRLQAALLYKRASWTEAAGMVGSAALFGAMTYLWADMRGGWNDHPSWEPFAGIVLGAALGLGIARPFAEWLRLQARMTAVQLRIAEHSASTRQSSEVTARRIEDLVEAGLTGEWPVAASYSDLDDGPPPVDG